ncbi:MAG TPA: prepilin peptidase [Pseudonocardiaceae bacterium]|nr:prepilin peptidase [Pseudonocardiaceae bacterium]
MVLGRLREPVRLPVGVAEGVVGLVWAVVAARAVAGGMPGWWVPAPAALGWLAVVLTATDVAQRRLPNVITMPAYPVAGALLVVVCGAGGGVGLGVRAAVAGALLLAVYATVHLVAPGQLGAGDVKLAGVVGLALGAMGWPAVLVGQVIAAVVTVGFAVGTAGRRGSPHGPGMLAGALLLAVFPGTVAVVG